MREFSSIRIRLFWQREPYRPDRVAHLVDGVAMRAEQDRLIPRVDVAHLVGEIPRQLVRSAWRRTQVEVPELPNHRQVAHHVTVTGAEQFPANVLDAARERQCR